MSVVARRMTAQIDGDFVVFLIGARLNKWWKLPTLIWMGRAMNAMIKELDESPESGFLGCEQWGGTANLIVQYWRSPEHLIAYARSKDATHYPAWVRFNKEVGSNGDVGIWHETYSVRAGEYEAIYNNMPEFGLAKAAVSTAAEGQLQSALGRLGRTVGSDAPVAPNGEER
jgi:hypothetical protein